MNVHELVYRPHSPQHLSEFDTRSKAGLAGKADSRECLDEDVKKLVKLQEAFAAAKQNAILIILQGMDAAGKDGIIKHVMSGTNPQGVNVYGFRKPTEEEVLHDYLWRESKVLPERGRISIFNRSYYEEVLIVRVQPEILANEGLQASGPSVWSKRYEDINNFERHLTNCGTVVLKFFLHLSKAEQRKRLLCRLQTPHKMWKASDADLDGHARWDDYQRVYGETLAATSTAWAPWYVVPADRKWVSRAVVGRVVVETLERLDPTFPEPDAARRERYAALAKQLEAEV